MWNTWFYSNMYSSRNRSYTMEYRIHYRIYFRVIFDFFPSSYTFLINLPKGIKYSIRIYRGLYLLGLIIGLFVPKRTVHVVDIIH